MGEMIGTLDDMTLHAELQLEDLGPLARVYWSMTRGTHPNQFKQKFGSEKGTLQFFYPGPVVEYQLKEGSYNVQIFNNGGNIKISEELHRQLIQYVQRGSS